MKILAPLGKVEEAERLVAAGADELYCGVQPREWEGRFGELLANRRKFGNLHSLSDLERVVNVAHGSDASVSLTLNAQHYSPKQTDYILALAASAAEIGVDAFIVGDAGILAALAAKKMPVRLHVSSIASCRNSQAANWYRELGASRVILPRQVTLAEVATMVRAVPELDFEVFGLNDGCIYEEGVCHTIHLEPQQGGPICLDPYDYQYRRTDGAEPDDEERANLARHEKDHAEWSWYTYSCGFTMTEEGLSHGPCAFCAIPTLQEIGVTALKIVGREAGFGRKLRSVQMMKAVIDKMAAGVDEEELQAFAKGMRNKPELCRSGYMCYFPDILDRPIARPADGAEMRQS